MAGVQIDGVNNKIDFDDDQDTSISANTDDTLVFEVAGATDFTMTANTFTAAAGSTIAAQALTATTGAFTDSVTITTNNNNNQLTLISTDADGGAGPKMTLQRDSASPADGDVAGRIHFVADDDGGNTFEAALIDVTLNDVSNGSEDATLDIKGIVAGSEVKKVSFGAETVFNEDSADIDFRVESNDNTHMLFVDGGNNRVGIGTTPDLGGGLHIKTSDSGVSSVDSSYDELILERGSHVGMQLLSSTSTTGQILFVDSDAISGRVAYDHSVNALDLKTSATDRLKIQDGNFYFIRMNQTLSSPGMWLSSASQLRITVQADDIMTLNREGDDGNLVLFRQANSTEGTISVSGSTVSYNGFTGTHWSRLADNSKPTILRGTIMESINTMMDWYQAVADVAEVKYTAEDERVISLHNEVGEIKIPAGKITKSITLPENKSVGDAVTFTASGIDDIGNISESIEYTGTYQKEADIKHVYSKVSDTADSTKVYGLFNSWDEDEDTVNDMIVAQVGTFIIRVNKDVTVEAGDLLVSNGDGTAKKQEDDIIRSKTVAKVNSNVKIETYSDGSYTVPCTLHC